MNAFLVFVRECFSCYRVAFHSHIDCPLRGVAVAIENGLEICPYLYMDLGAPLQTKLAESCFVFIRNCLAQALICGEATTSLLVRSRSACGASSPRWPPDWPTLTWRAALGARSTTAPIAAAVGAQASPRVRRARPARARLPRRRRRRRRGSSSGCRGAGRCCCSRQVAWRAPAAWRWPEARRGAAAGAGGAS